jgi:hypothetical protein
MALGIGNEIGELQFLIYSEITLDIIKPSDDKSAEFTGDVTSLGVEDVGDIKQGASVDLFQKYRLAANRLT